MSGATLLAAEGHGSERSCARVEGEGGGGEGGQAAPYPYPARRAGSLLVLARRWARAARAWLRGVPGEREWCLGVQMCSRRGDIGEIQGRYRGDVQRARRRPYRPRPPLALTLRPHLHPSRTPTLTPAPTPTPTLTPAPTPAPAPTPDPYPKPGAVRCTLSTSCSCSCSSS